MEANAIKYPENTKKEAKASFFVTLNALLDLGLLADSVAEIIELRSAYLSSANRFNGNDCRGMYGKNLFAADIIRNASNRDRFADAAVLSGDNRAVKGLRSLAVSFLDANDDTYGITDVHFGKLRLHILLRKCLN